MSNLPTLIVEGNDTTWVQAVPYPEWPFVVRVDGNLPTVTEYIDPAEEGKPGAIKASRPLHVGDRVWLATECPCEYEGCGYVEFATATVADIVKEWQVVEKRVIWFVTVTDVESFGQEMHDYRY